MKTIWNLIVSVISWLSALGRTNDGYGEIDPSDHHISGIIADMQEAEEKRQKELAN